MDTINLRPEFNLRTGDAEGKTVVARRLRYSDPGWYRQPPGTSAYEWIGALAEPARSDAAGGQVMAPEHQVDMEVTVRKPVRGMGHD